MSNYYNRQWRLPNSWNGTESNVNKQSNYSMYIDSTPYIKSSLPVDELNEITISLWFKTSQSNQSDGVLISFPESTTATGLDISLQYSNPNEKIRFNTYTHSSNDRVEANFNYSDNNWHHLICSYNGSVHNIYIDGVLKASESASGTLKNAQNEFFIGAFNTTYPSLRADNTFFDQVCVFNYPLSDGGVSVGQTATGQIATLYGGGSAIGNPMSLSPAPVAFYPLGDQDSFNGANYLVPNSSLKDYVFDFGTFTSNDRIVINNNFDTIITGTDFTISSWINLDSIASNQLKFIFTNETLQLTITNKITTYLRGASGYFLSPFDSNTTLSTGEWYNVVLVKSGSDYTYYLNGSSDGTVNNSTSVVNSSETTSLIGDYYGTGTLGFDGRISNTQIFNSALPATGSNSIETLYNNGSPLTSMTGFTSLQGWWKLDASATYDGTDWTIPDDSTNSNDGTSSGMTQSALQQSDLSFTSGYSPYALDFDAASSDYIDCGSPSTLDFERTDAFSISAWVKRVGSGTTQFIFSKATNSSPYTGYSIYINPSNQITSNINISYSSNHLSVNGNSTLNTSWNHVCVTYDGSSNASGIKLYINGSEETTSSTGQASITGTLSNSYPVNIAARNSTDLFFNGSISNVSIWNVALTSAQVSEIYNEGVPSNLNNHSAYSNLVSWWQLGSNSSFNTNWTVLDEKGSNDGTSVNMDEVDIVDGVGSYANGLSSGMGGDEVIGDAPYSTANSLSVNMDALDRVEDTPS